MQIRKSLQEESQKIRKWRSVHHCKRKEKLGNYKIRKWRHANHFKRNNEQLRKLENQKNEFRKLL